MGFNFPDTPALGAAFGNYIWDGEKWTLPTGGSGVPAAPFDALSCNGMQINGSLEIAQERTLTSVPTGTLEKYAADCWLISKSGTSVISAYLISPGPPSPFFSSALQLEAATAQASIGSDFVRFSQRIEGYRIARLGWGTSAALPVTVGFWARMTLPGTYRALMYNFDASSLTAWVPFTINTSMVWQWVSITFPPVTSGTWRTDNTIGLTFSIEVASSATPNTVGALSRYAAITGVIILPGTQAPSAAQSPLIMRPYDQELASCQRYFDSGMVMMQVPTNGSLIQSIPWHVRMRVVPTVTLAVLDPGSGTSPIVLNLASADTGAFQITAAAANGYARSSYSADARL